MSEPTAPTAPPPPAPAAGSGFMKGFIPGIVIGVVIGAFAAIVLDPVIGGRPSVAGAGRMSAGEHRGADVPREEQTNADRISEMEHQPSGDTPPAEPPSPSPDNPDE